MAALFENALHYENDQDTTDGTLTDEESLSNSDPIGTDLDQETMTNTSQVEDSGVNQDDPCATHLDEVVNDQSLSDLECGISNTSDNLDMGTSGKMKVTFNAGVNGNMTHSINNISNEVVNTTNTTRSSLGHPRSILQNKSTGGNVASNLENRRIEQYDSTSADLNKNNALCCKLSIVFVMFCIIGCSLMPIAFYYVTQLGEKEITHLEYSHEKNTSSAKINLMRNCNFTDSDCVDKILYTYEALRTINLPSSQQYCSERVETLFCDALMECSNESYVKDIVCQQVRQEYCTAEWRMLEVHNQANGLIDCEEYEETAPLNCSDQFDLANDGSVCLPLCREFSQYSDTYTTPHVVLAAVSLFISIIGGVTVVAISYKKRKKMFHFPQGLVVINAGIIIILSSLVLISTLNIVIGGQSILCSRKFLFDAIDNPTPFCTVQGCLVTSGASIHGYFWMLYICHLALRIFYPMKSAKFFNSRSIHIVEILIVLFIGTIPSIVSAGLSNYEIITFPPIQCALNREARYYEVVVPIVTSIAISEILMLLTLYKIHVRHGIFKRKQQESADKKVCTCQFTVPEIKIGFVLFYWIVLVVMLWTGSSVRAGRDDIFQFYLRSYTDCMAGGNRKHHDCYPLRQDLEAEANPVSEVIVLSLTAFLPFASLPFVIQFQTVKTTVRQASRNLSLKLLAK